MIISEYRILQSSAGYYVGRLCFDPTMPEAGLNIPYDRVGEYYAQKTDATTCLLAASVGMCRTQNERDAFVAYILNKSGYGDHDGAVAQVVAIAGVETFADDDPAALNP
ncbi:MAG: hypothetical protein U9P11_01260 [Pseudomonadota bacterium]|nr:hypothetical protein [Pseudomonadota bacterium]